MHKNRTTVHCSMHSVDGLHKLGQRVRMLVSSLISGLVKKLYRESRMCDTREGLCATSVIMTASRCNGHDCRAMNGNSAVRYLTQFDGEAPRGQHVDQKSLPLVIHDRSIPGPGVGDTTRRIAGLLRGLSKVFRTRR